MHVVMQLCKFVKMDLKGKFVYAVTAAEGIILSLFTSNEQ